MPHRALMPRRLTPVRISPLQKPVMTNTKRWRMSVLLAVIVFLASAGIAVLATELFHDQTQVIRPAIQTNVPAISTQNGLTISMEPKDWVKLVVKPLVAEVGGLVVFQAIGMPMISEMFWLARRLRWMRMVRGTRRLRWLPFLQKTRPSWARALATRSPLIRALPKRIRTLPRSIVKLYKRRARLAIASEYTNFIGNEDEN
jgi:hypothetical protein